MVRLLSITLLLALSTLSAATEPLFTRSKAWWPAQYGSNCCVTPGYYYYVYTPYVVPTEKPTYQATSYVDDDFAALLRVASARDTEILKERAFDQRHKARLELVSAMGLQGNFRIGNYAPGLGYGYSQSYGVGAYGHTLSGYTAQSVIQQEGYSQTDVNALNSLAAQLTAQHINVADKAHVRFDGLVAATSQQAGNIAEIRARIRGATDILDHLQNPKTVVTQTTNGWTVAPPGQPPIQYPQSSVAPQKTLGQAFNEDCARCHSPGQKYNYAFSLEAYAAASPERRAKMKSTLRSTDQERRMPRNDDLSPGNISQANLDVWDRN